MDENGCFKVTKSSNPLLTRLLVIFVFSRLFDRVMTVEGEEFINRGTEKNCYKLVRIHFCFRTSCLEIERLM